MRIASLCALAGVLQLAPGIADAETSWYLTGYGGAALPLYAQDKTPNAGRWVWALQILLGVELLAMPTLENLAREGSAPGGFWSFPLQMRVLFTGDATLTDSGGQAVRADGLTMLELYLGVGHNVL